MDETAEQNSSLAVGLNDQLHDLSRSRSLAARSSASNIRERRARLARGRWGRVPDVATRSGLLRPGLSGKVRGRRRPSNVGFGNREYFTLRRAPSGNATQNPSFPLPGLPSSSPLGTNSLQFPQLQRGPRNTRRERGPGGTPELVLLPQRSSAGPRRAASFLPSSRPARPEEAAEGGGADPSAAPPPRAGAGGAQPASASRGGSSAAQRRGQRAPHSNLPRKDSLRPTMHRGGQPLKKRRGSFKMAELDQLPDESSSAKALVSLKEGSLSNTWNEKYSSLQKTPVWKGRNTSPAVEMKFTATMSTPDKKASQKIGFRLRNLLKLPKAHKWCIYEWFYSNIDKPLFEGDNDFCVCLKESFPNLKTRKLTRVEWGKIRRLMGKPRRCSSAFFEEERSALKQKRQKIRLLQQRKVADVSQFKDLPDEIPLPLVIGTKVTARLRGVHDGLFTGQIDAVDTLNATYRVTFDRAGLGTHTIPDYEVLSNEPHETMPIAAFGQKQRPSRFFMTPPRLHYTPPLQSPIMDNDPLLGQSPWRSKISGSDTETLGGFPVEFLIQVTRLSKILMIKKEHIKKLREMNTDAEKLKSYSMPISIEFQRRYATIVLELEQLNKDLNKVLHKVQQYCYELAPDQGLQPADQPTDMRRRCEEEAQEIVRHANSSTGHPCVENENLTDLISRLTAILLQIKCLAEGGDLNSFEFKSLTDSLNDIKSTIDASNISCFQNNVEIHVAHIQSGLSQMGNLHAFAANNTNRD
ncbi:protein lin-9 homolog isoform X2 [Trachypithecus francoisi]|nr:protein lin-9 homolog isoform X2 [Trachypithecus francoisi]